MQPFITIRTARPDELAAIISVDDDACRRYATPGLMMNLHDGHPFVIEEQTRWARSLASGDGFIAEDAAHRAIGIAVLGRLDAEPYLDQLSVRLEHVGQGVGSALLNQAITWARGRGPGLWLNTYRHLPWNRPFYEVRGFTLVDESSWRPEMRETIKRQRACLPLPGERVVMFRPRSGRPAGL
jgi:GNAT superfamily N-acetyltransferase